jgi:hypothetical protein
MSRPALFRRDARQPDKYLSQDVRRGRQSLTEILWGERGETKVSLRKSGSGCAKYRSQFAFFMIRDSNGEEGGFVVVNG